MDLLLWRHAQAHDALPGQDDLDRALTAKGERQAREAAAWLAEVLPADARVLVSPARRTQQTAQALCRAHTTAAALRPDAPVDSVLRATGWSEAPGTVVVVGHQPTLGQVAAQLLCGTPQPWSVRKGAVWWLRCERRDGTARATLLAVR